MRTRVNLNTKQIEELAKLLITLGHLFIGSLVLKAFEQQTRILSFGIVLTGLVISIYYYFMGIKLLKHSENVNRSN